MHTQGIVRRSWLLVLSVVAALGILSAVPAGQVGRKAEVLKLLHVVTGSVLMPDGSAAAGAVVVTSAGGQTVTGADGSFALTVELPLDAESLEVTAVADERAGSGSLVARARIVPAALSPTTSVGHLTLTPSSDCIPRWLPTFGGLRGTDGTVSALAVFDDGRGPALYAGGDFTTVGGSTANHIAKWDGSRWSALGSGMDNIVSALTVHDDGSGPALYAGGSFLTAGGVTVNRIARWNGSSWSALGSGMNDSVLALTVYDTGAGPRLYACGSFTTAGGVAANRIARWNGSNWFPLGFGATGRLDALAVYDDGSGPALYAGGVDGIGKWNGIWSLPGGGLIGGVSALAVYDDGSGPALYASGGFATVGGRTAIARWDGSSWSAFGSGLNNFVGALAVHDDGNGLALYAGGGFTTIDGVAANHIAKWDGSSWSPLGSGMAYQFSTPSVRALTTYDDGSGPALYAGGSFESAGGVAANNVAKWDGSEWSGLGILGLNSDVQAVTVYDDGSGPALYAGGLFTAALGSTANYVAKWDGSDWVGLGTAITNPLGVREINALAAYDDGSGLALYAGGGFTTVGGVAANYIAKWDGSSWSPLGSGMSHTFSPSVIALTVHDDGGGPALYAGGRFTSAGGVAANNVAKWDGSSWSALGSGVSNDVTALAVFDDGSGPALYAGGFFVSAGGVPASRIAKWDGASWSALGSGTDYVVLALTGFDDGSGPALYAGGNFTTAGGVPAINIARWDGSTWSALGRPRPRGSGLGDPSTFVTSLTVFDSGNGPAVHAGGSFVRRLVRWDGSTWNTLGPRPGGPVKALTNWDDGRGPALVAGGAFAISSAGDSYVAKWGCRPRPVKERRL